MRAMRRADRVGKHGRTVRQRIADGRKATVNMFAREHTVVAFFEANGYEQSITTHVMAMTPAEAERTAEREMQFWNVAGIAVCID